MGEGVAQRYWYDAESAERQVLEAIRAFGRADLGMRRRMAGGMDMGVTDMRALQIVIAGERRGQPITAAHLAAGLGITTASTAKLLNRLEVSGHIVRMRNEADGRSVCIVATDHAHEEVRARLGVMHDRMREVAHRFTPEQLVVVAEFMNAMVDVFDSAGDVPPLTPRP